MPRSTTFKVIYLGQQTIIDPTEGTNNGGTHQHNTRAEDADKLLHIPFDNLTVASVQQLDAVSYDSPDNNGHTGGYNQDNTFNGYDKFKITASDGTETVYDYDAAAYYSGTITYNDGTTATVNMIIMQDPAGHTWLAPPPSDTSADALAMVAKPIQAIQLDTLLGNNYTALVATLAVLDVHTVPCFTSGTMIETADGLRAVEDIAVGDLVQTADHGLQKLRWTGRRELGAEELSSMPNLRPIRIRAGALGRQMPAHDLIVSPQHRILVRSRIAQRLFDANEVLVAAKQLLAIDGIEIAEDVEDVVYIHLMFDRHEVIYSNGAATESLYAGPEALRSIDVPARQELMTLFPALQLGILPEPARPFASGRKGRKLAMRHAQNGKPLSL